MSVPALHPALLAEKAVIADIRCMPVLQNACESWRTPDIHKSELEKANRATSFRWPDLLNHCFPTQPFIWMKNFHWERWCEL